MTEANDPSHDPVNIHDFEALAKEHLPEASYDHIAGGATDEITIRRIRTVFDAISLRPRMLIDVAKVDTSTTVLGHTLQHPIMIDTARAHGRSHPEAELATARATGAEYGLFRS